VLKLSDFARNKKGEVMLQYKCACGVARPFGGAIFSPNKVKTALSFYHSLRII
jgi:hypothetical protein